MLLLLLFIASEAGVEAAGGSSEDLTVGRKFLVVFLENIAYYHPTPATNKIQILAVRENTQVIVTYPDGTPENRSTLTPGVPQTFSVPSQLELDRSETSTRVVSVNATEDVSVKVLNQRSNSFQTTLALPTDQLGTSYQIPPVPGIQMTTIPEEEVTNQVTERSQFRLVLVNAGDQDTQVNLKDRDYTLAPGQVRQLSVEQNMTGTEITGDKPFMVLFGHPCAIQVNCTCGLLYAPLRPKATAALNYILPPPLLTGAEGQSVLLKPSSGNSEEVSGSMVFSDPGPVLLQRPGLLLNLVPKEDFGSCFSVVSVTGTSSWAVVLAPKDSTDKVMLGKSQNVTTSWTPVSGSDFSWTSVPLDQGEHVLWHKDGLMAVWLLGEKVPGLYYGHEAAKISKNPDYRGCVLVPEHIQVLDQQTSWQESIAECRSLDLELISFSDAMMQEHVYKNLKDQDQEQDLWMGLRQSSYSGKWYWISDEALNHVDWAPGSPGSEDEGQCGSISLSSSQGLKWKHRDCCKQAKAVCYRPPELVAL
ncbi:unnamed protein product [Knipowitschia caucasica]